MTKYQQQLMAELMEEGASRDEALAMSRLALRLGELDPAEPARRGWSRGLGVVIASTLVGVTGVLLLAVLSLPSLPGAWNHPFKAGLEATAVKVDPSLATAVMMDKSWEVAQLSAQHASAPRVMAALADYSAYFGQLPAGDHYAAWGYCSQELETAEQHESGSVRQAIEQSYQRIPPARGASQG